MQRPPTGPELAEPDREFSPVEAEVPLLPLPEIPDPDVVTPQVRLPVPEAIGKFAKNPSDFYV